MFVSDLIVRVERAAPAWDLLLDAPELATRIEPRFAELVTSLREGIPVMRDVGVVDHAPYVRPPGHRRSFYRTLSSGVLAIKGSEPLSMNLDAFLAELADGRVHVECRLGSPARDGTLARAFLSGLDKFPILEGKVPACVTLAEALADARAAAAVQHAYLERYGELARLPLPLFVGRWGDDVTATISRALRPRLRGRALEVVDGCLARGLGVYAYYYPSLPLRLAHLAIPDADSRDTFAARLAALGRLEPRVLFGRWITLVARLLALGFVPKDPTTLVTGDCLQVQNIVLDGGFADADSLVVASELDDRALRDALRRTVHELALTGTRLLAGLRVSTVELRDRLPDLHAVVWNDLRELVRAEPVRDARIAAALTGRVTAYDGLVAILDDAFAV